MHAGPAGENWFLTHDAPPRSLSLQPIPRIGTMKLLLLALCLSVVAAQRPGQGGKMPQRPVLCAARNCMCTTSFRSGAVVDCATCECKVGAGGEHTPPIPHPSPSPTARMQFCTAGGPRAKSIHQCGLDTIAAAAAVCPLGPRAA